jgi:hypothetical protein
MRKRLTPGTVLALIALFVALSGTATAASVALITGAQIKNGSIGLVDLSAGAKRSLKGTRGLRGTPGPPGPIGSPGPQGPPGVQSIKQYHYAGTLGPGEFNGFAMTCPPGEGIVSGGGFSSIGIVFSDHVSGNGWIYLVDNGSSISINIDGYISCAPGLVVAATGPIAETKASELAARAARG